jgi:hypothetical protein
MYPHAPLMRQLRIDFEEVSLIRIEPSRKRAMLDREKGLSFLKCFKINICDA